MKETKENDCLGLWKERPRKSKTERKRRIRVLNNWLLFTMPNGRNLSNRINEERWTEPITVFKIAL